MSNRNDESIGHLFSNLDAIADSIAYLLLPDAECRSADDFDEYFNRMMEYLVDRIAETLQVDASDAETDDMTIEEVK